MTTVSRTTSNNSTPYHSILIHSLHVKLVLTLIQSMIFKKLDYETISCLENKAVTFTTAFPFSYTLKIKYVTFMWSFFPYLISPWFKKEKKLLYETFPVIFATAFPFFYKLYIEYATTKNNWSVPHLNNNKLIINANYNYSFNLTVPHRSYLC